MISVTRFKSPPFAYVPGQTPRHDPSQFNLLCATAKPGMSVSQLLSSDAWVAGIQFLNSDYNWEAHEVFEPVWQALPNPSPERTLTRALIQLANAQLKRKMNRPNAVLRLCDQVVELMDGLPNDAFVTCGVVRETLEHQVDQLRSTVILRNP